MLLNDPWAEDVSVLSSENVAFGIESAGLGSRCAASVCDMLLQVLIISLGSIVVAGITTYFPLAEWSQLAQNVATAIGIAIVFLVIWGYYFLFEWLWDGQTPGKRALGLRVIQIDGMPLTPWGALVRNVVRVADFLPPIYGLGAVVMIFNANQRRAGDLVAGTIVARERHDASRQVLDIAQAADAFLASTRSANPVVAPNKMAATIATLAGETSTNENSDALGAMVAQARLKAGDWEMLSDFVARRDKLKPEVRARLAARICEHLAPKLEQIAPAPHERERWIVTLFAQQPNE